MKADTKPTLQDVAAQLCPGPPPDWVLARLRQNALLVGFHIGTDNDDVELQLYASALYLRDWLPMYVRVAKMIGEDYPDCIDPLTTALEELIPILAKDIRPPTAHRPPDLRRRLCAAVCLGIWREVRGVEQPYSPKLWAACEAYWVACGHPPNPSGNVKRWERLLEEKTTT
jgi:hypothetical protein